MKSLETAFGSSQMNIYRNVEYLKTIVADTEIVNSGEDIADLIAAIATGEAKLAENIWPAADAE